MNPNHDKEGKFTTSNGVGSKLNKMGFGPDRSSQNFVRDENGNLFYELPSDLDVNFLKFVDENWTDEEIQDFNEYGTISAEKFDDIFGDEDYLEEAIMAYKGKSNNPPMTKEDYLSNRADEINDEEKLNG